MGDKSEWTKSIGVAAMQSRPKSVNSIRAEHGLDPLEHDMPLAEDIFRVKLTETEVEAPKLIEMVRWEGPNKNQYAFRRDAIIGVTASGSGWHEIYFVTAREIYRAMNLKSIEEAFELLNATVISTSPLLDEIQKVKKERDKAQTNLSWEKRFHATDEEKIVKLELELAKMKAEQAKEGLSVIEPGQEGGLSAPQGGELSTPEKKGIMSSIFKMQR